MRLLLNVLLSLMLMGMLCVVAGCDGEGIILNTSKAVDGDDVIDDDDDDEVDPVPDEVTNLGTWITSYADDDVHVTAYGPQQYAAVVKLQRQSNDLTGTGTVYRIVEGGSSSPDKLTIKLSGSISGDNATLAVTSATGGTVSDMPTWRLRFAGTYLVGAYQSVNSSNQLVRNGHALWRRVSTGSLEGSWVSGYSDTYGTTALPARDKTGVMVLTHDTTSQTISGSGTLVEQQPGDVVDELSFNISDSTVSSPSVGFTMGDLDLASNEIDWFGLWTSGALVGAYAQYDVSNRQVRSGHGTWYLAGSAQPSDVSATWATSFSDSGVAANEDPSAYLFSVKLTAEEGNIVSGSGSMIDVPGGLETSRLVNVEGGTIVGSRVQLDMKVPATRDVFSWDLRVAGNVMVGSYQRRDGLGQYISSGTAEWRKERTTPSPKGTWASSFFDSLRPEGTELTQFALVNVASEATDGTLSGNGSLRHLNGETGRRLFNLVSSSVEDDEVTWVWRGTDLFGDTTWKLRHAGDFLYGVYENQTSNGNVEAIGSATWIRTSTSSSF